MDTREPNWAPLEATIPADKLPDWMWMGRVAHAGAVIEQYKHRNTRRYLNLDQSGQAWRVNYSVPSDPEAPTECSINQIPAAEAIYRALT